VSFETTAQMPCLIAEFQGPSQVNTKEDYWHGLRRADSVVRGFDAIQSVHRQIQLKPSQGCQFGISNHDNPSWPPQTGHGREPE